MIAYEWIYKKETTTTASTSLQRFRRAKLKLARVLQCTYRLSGKFIRNVIELISRCCFGRHSPTFINWLFNSFLHLINEISFQKLKQQINNSRGKNTPKLIKFHANRVNEIFYSNNKPDIVSVSFNFSMDCCSPFTNVYILIFIRLIQFWKSHKYNSMKFTLVFMREKNRISWFIYCIHAFALAHGKHKSSFNKMNWNYRDL